MRSSEVLRNRGAAAIGERHHRTERLVLLVGLEVHPEDRGEKVENPERGVVGKLGASLLRLKKSSKSITKLIAIRRH